MNFVLTFSCRAVTLDEDVAIFCYLNHVLYGLTCNGCRYDFASIPVGPVVFLAIPLHGGCMPWILTHSVDWAKSLPETCTKESVNAALPYRPQMLWRFEILSWRL